MKLSKLCLLLRSCFLQVRF